MASCQGGQEEEKGKGGEINGENDFKESGSGFNSKPENARKPEKGLADICKKERLVVKKEFYLVSALAIFGIMFIAVLVHEATHIVLGQGARGICFGNCDGAMARVWISSPAGAGELVPNIVATVVTTVLSAMLFISRMFTERIH